MSLLNNIKLSESEEKEFVASLTEWQETKAAEIKTKLENQLKEYQEKISTLEKKLNENSPTRVTADGDLDLNDKETEIMKGKLTEWRETVKKETEDELGDKFYEAFKKGEEDLKKNYSEKFIATMKEMYEEIEGSVKDKLQESAEFKAFSDLKKIVAPFLMEGEYSDTVLDDNKKLKHIIKEQAQKLEDIKIKTKLDQLTDGMPKQIKEDFIASLGDFKTEDELVEKFQRNIKLIKNVKEQIFHEMEDNSKKANVEAEAKKAEAPTSVVKDATKAEDTLKSAKAALSESEELKKKATEALTKPEAKKETPAAKPAEEDLETLKENIDYDIISEDFKRVEEKPDALKRMRELAGL